MTKYVTKYSPNAMVSGNGVHMYNQGLSIQYICIESPWYNGVGLALLMLSLLVKNPMKMT